MPADYHVHTQWSWDASRGDMDATCARAAAIGLPAVAFTEHLDHTVWTLPVDLPAPTTRIAELVEPDGTLRPRPFDVAGYFAAVDECRRRYPGLRILTGVEAGEPHWHAEQVAAVLAAGRFDRVLGSLHSLPAPGGGVAEPWALFGRRDARDLMREYLAEVIRLIEGSDVFGILAHLDYPVRSWPAGTAGPFDPAEFTDEYRAVLRTLAGTGRALEFNTRVPLDPVILRWWRQEGGGAISFGSDAHQPAALAHGFAEAAAVAESCGFRPGRDPADYWIS